MVHEHMKKKRRFYRKCSHKTDVLHGIITGIPSFFKIYHSSIISFGKHTVFLQSIHFGSDKNIFCQVTFSQFQNRNRSDHIRLRIPERKGKTNLKHPNRTNRPPARVDSRAGRRNRRRGNRREKRVRERANLSRARPVPTRPSKDRQNSREASPSPASPARANRKSKERARVDNPDRGNRTRTAAVRPAGRIPRAPARSSRRPAAASRAPARSRKRPA